VTVEFGGLMSYEPTSRTVIVKLASIPGNILKGAKPADLRSQATEFQFVINLHRGTLNQCRLRCSPSPTR
jgi:hypothetical protein